MKKIKEKFEPNAKIWFSVAAKTISSTYWAVTIPLRIAFFPDFRINSIQWSPFIILDFLALILFLLDAIQSYKRHRLDYLAGKLNRISPESFLVGKPGVRKSENDITSSFQVDENRSTVTRFQLFLSVLAAFPFEYLSIPFKSIESLPSVLLMNRLFIVIHMPKYFEQLSNHLEEANIVRNIGVQRALKLFFAMALAGHWCSCGFFIVSKLQMTRGIDVTWVEDLEIMKYTTTTIEGQSNAIGVELAVPVHYAYIQSLYWAYITMITTGFGDIVPLTVSETLWCILSMSIGVIITTCAIANLQLVVTNVDAAFTEFQQKMETINRYMRYRRLPKDLQSRITTFYRYQWDTLRGADEEKIMSDLPTSLQQQVANFMFRDLIASLPILRGANTALLNALADCTQINIYSPNDVILKTGDPIKGAIIVSRGEIEILHANQIERKLKRQDHFGAESLFEPKICNRTVKSYTFSEVFFLPSDAFLRAIHSQCDSNQIKKMEDTALLAFKSESKVNKMFGSGIETIPLSRYQLLLHPESVFRFSWDMVMLFCFIFYLFSLPVMLMNYLDGASFQDSIVHFFLSYLVDAFFLVDAYLRFNHFMYYEEGLVIFEKKRIRHKYLKEHNMFWEFISLLPLDFLSIFIKRRYQYIFRSTKLLKLKNFRRSLRVFERAVSDWKLEGSLIILRIIKLNLALLVTCHWVGCLWHGFANIGQWVGYEETWLQADESDVSLSIDHSEFGTFGPYLRSIYWAIVGMSTVGYGDIVPVNILETGFATIIILFGGLIIPAIVGGLAAYLGNMNGAEKIYRKRLSRIKQYMRHRSIRKELIDRVVNYCEYLWSRQGSIDEEEIMNELPLPLRQSVAIYINKTNMSSSLFQYCDDSLKESIALALKPRIFLPSDTIIYEGDVGTSMFFIERGTVLLSSTDGLCLSVLNRGMYFGESSLLFSTLHTYSALATTFCDVFELGKDEFHEILSTSIIYKKTLGHIKSLCKHKSGVHRNILMNLNRRPKIIGDISDYKLTEIEKVTSKRIVLVSPDSIVRTLWSVVVLLIIVYNCWVVPFHLTFGINASQLKLDFILDIFLFLDMVFHYCLFATRLDGEILCDIEKVKRNYIRKRFWIDALATFPYDFLFFLFFGSYTNAALLLSFLRVPKLIWIIRLPGILDDVFRCFEGTDISMGPLKLIEFLAGVILMAHWAACGFYALAKWKGEVGASGFTPILQSAEATKWKDTWINRQIMNGKLPVDGGRPWQQYIRAFNWALPTLVVVVIGDVVPVNMNETFYAFIWMIIGVSVNAAIIGNVANIVANIDSDSSLFAKKAEEVKRLMITTNVSIDLQSRIESFVASLWLHRDAAEEEAFLSKLPETLQIQITEYSRQWHIRNCPFFDFCSFDIVKTLSLRLKSALFSSGDVIVYHGDMGHEMFFLERGTVEVLAKNNQTVFATLSADNECDIRMPVFFGETSLFFKTQRQNTVRAITFCEVYILRKEDLDLELRQRNFDMSRMLDVFTHIAHSNTKRNSAVTANLRKCRESKSKISKLIDPIQSFSSYQNINTKFLPNSRFRICWDVTCLVLALYSVLEIPFRAIYCFFEPTTTDIMWISLNLFVDILFIIECYLRYNFLLFSKNGKIITDKERIKLEYKRNGMWIDVIANSPLSILAIGLGWKSLYTLRLIHLLRVLRLPSYFERIEGYLIIKLQFRIGAASKLLARVFLLYLLAIHFFSCAWFAIHRFLEHEMQYTWATTDCPGGQIFATEGCLSSWIEESNSHDICHDGLIAKCYVRSFYFVLTTMSSVGYGDISPVTELETIFQNIVVLTGACFFAGIIGAFGEYFAYNDQSGSSAFRTKLHKLRDYLSYRQLPSIIQNNIVFFHKARWKKTRVLNQMAAISLLSSPLQMDLSFESSMHLIQKFPIFNECSTIIVKRICHNLNMYICPAGTSIYKAGDIGFDIYFIGAGLVKVTLPKDLSILDEEGRANSVKAQEKSAAIGLLYRPGNHFGESCLDSSSGVRQETAETKTVVELYVLAKSQLESILNYAPLRERSRLLRNLLFKNGNVQHCFDPWTSLHEKGIARLERSSAVKTTSFLSWSKPHRHASVISSPSSSEQESKTSNRKYRLLSFSAHAIQARRRLSASEKNYPLIAAAQMQNLVEQGQVSLEQESCDSSSEND